LAFCFVPSVAFSQVEPEDHHVEVFLLERDDDDPDPDIAETQDIAADAEHFPEGEPPPVLEVNGRLHTRWARTIEERDPATGSFSLARARLQLTWRPLEPVEGQLGADFAPVLSGADTTSRLLPQILDAFAAVEATKWLTLRAGHRKVPFSGARLRSLGDLRPIRRGEYVGFVSTGDAADLADTSLGYAGRKVGFDASLRFKRLLRLRLDLGLSQGDHGATDPTVRASVRVAKGLRVGAAAAALRSPDAPTEQGFWALAYELDVEYDRKRWHAELEAATGKNWLEPGPASGRPSFVGGYALAAYDISLGEGRHPSIEPHLRAELVDESSQHSCDETLGGTVGATLHAFDVVRLQLDLERLERPASAGGETCAGVANPDETTVMLQLALDV